MSQATKGQLLCCYVCFSTSAADMKPMNKAPKTQDFSLGKVLPFLIMSIAGIALLTAPTNWIPQRPQLHIKSTSIPVLQWRERESSRDLLESIWINVIFCRTPISTLSLATKVANPNKMPFVFLSPSSHSSQVFPPCLGSCPWHGDFT